jgi:hypothetical protein
MRFRAVETCSWSMIRKVCFHCTFRSYSGMRQTPRLVCFNAGVQGKSRSAEVFTEFCARLGLTEAWQEALLSVSGEQLPRIAQPRGYSIN